MATALQQQLAAIAANSTHQLDLKAQKARHSKSLLFEPRDAATQSFDTIYQICFEGFEELCMLDTRFVPFGKSLFSEQSKTEDRTQMTAKENEELNSIVNNFLSLLCGRLLLKPAMKAMEWLVRRFRVEEHNTEAILMTFLPYHSSHVLLALLSILPDRLPPSFRFLSPYKASLQNLPRHAIVSAAISNKGFFSAFSNYVLKSSRAQHHSAILIGFWASVTAQAVNGMVDTTRSGRDEIRKQREEDILLHVLPVLQSALRLKGVPELYLGCCMIMTILATKVSLDDKVLDAMMEAVAAAWTEQTLEDGLLCLAVLAEEKQHIPQPHSVTLAVLEADSSLPLLEGLSQRHRTDRLLIATCIGAIHLNPSPHMHNLPEFTKATVERNLLSGHYLAYLRQAAYDKDVELPDGADQLPSASHEVEGGDASLEPSELMKIDEQELSDMENLMKSLAALPAVESNGQNHSFLDVSNDEIFIQYSAAFRLVLSSDQTLSRFLGLPALLRNQSANKPAFFSFLARVWATKTSTPARVRALEIAAVELKRTADFAAVDLQGFLPYTITALADESQRIRKAAANLCLTVLDSYDVRASSESLGASTQIWGADTLYASDTEKVRWLSTQDTHRFFKSAIITCLEDCVLDSNHVIQSLADRLKGLPTPKQGSASGKKELKATLQSAICTYLAGHVAASPVLNVKLRLLDVLNKVGKSASDARKTVLRPFVEEWCAFTVERMESLCTSQGSPLQHLDKAVLGSLSHRSADEIQTLKSIADGDLRSRTGLPVIALECLRHLWSAMKTTSQVVLVDFLVDLVVDNDEGGTSDLVQSVALETLRALRYPSKVLVHLLENLPNSEEVIDQPPSTKKRRTSKSDSVRPGSIDQAKLNTMTRRITLTLELIEGSRPGQHPQLLKGLFHLLGELHHYKLLLGSQLVYVQGLLMGCLLPVVDDLKNRSDASDIDRSVIRADLIVECVRTTSSAQVHKTALLLVSSLAGWVPDLVLHSVMPLFTFMSTTLLRQGDEYSAHVTDQTVSGIVPPLAASLKKRGKDLVSGAAELLLSFTAAFEHIPLHRRPGLFQHLVRTLGPEESLFAVVAMLIERYPTDSRTKPFVMDLMSNFPVILQLRAFKQYVDLVFDGLKPRRALSDSILGYGEKNPEQIEDSVDNLLQNLAELLRSTALRRRLAKELAKNDEGGEQLQAVYAQLLEQIMQLTRDLASNDSLKKTTDLVLESLLALTPTKDFIESSSKLMQGGSDQTRQQVFRSLESRVVQATRGDTQIQQVYIDVLPNCCVFIHQDQPVATRHAAITCIDQIVEKYGKTNLAAALETAEQVAGPAALGSDDNSLRVISILCLASMVEVLGDGCISILPDVLNQVFNYLEQALDDHPLDRQIYRASFTLAITVIDHLPWMLSSQHLDRLLRLAAVSASRDATAESSEFCSLAARRLSAAELFVAVERTFPSAVSNGMKAVDQHLEMLRSGLQNFPKATITKCSKVIFNIALQALDLRQEFGADDANGQKELYESVDQIGLELTLKLNDTTFRPFFIRLVEWATTDPLPKQSEGMRTCRILSLYHFAHLLFEQLKSIVTSYASFLLESASKLLDSLKLTNKQDRDLLEVVLQTLTSSFRHDQDDFWQAPAHFEIIAAPLINQLSYTTLLPASDHTIPAIVELAAAAASGDHHKVINAAIMSFMRDERAPVRLAAVKCERALTEKINFEWLNLLPEMLPFISELQEDDDESVERETLRWVKQIEEVSGESLEGMLQ